MRDSVHRKYTAEWLQLERPQPMYDKNINLLYDSCLLYTSPSPRDGLLSRMPSSA